MARLGQDIRTVTDRIERAVTHLVMHQPFFAAILLRMELLEGYVEKNKIAGTGPCPCPPGKVWPECKHTMATNGSAIWYNPRFVEILPDEELEGVLAHEVCHVAGLHPYRRGDRQPAAWNIATDQEVNFILTEADLFLPDHVIPGVGGKSAEELYQELPDDDGDGPPDVSDMGQPQRGMQPGNEQVGDVIDPTNPDGSAMSEAELQKAEQELKVAVQQAYAAAKACGQVPAGIKRMFEDAMEPRVPWQEILAQFIDSNYKNDYSWSRPNRRFIENDVLFPSVYSPGYGKVVMACDASGSVSKQELIEIGSEVLGALECYAERGQPAELDMCWFDTECHWQTVSDAEDLDPRGGGGTSFSTIFRGVEKQGLQPKAVIVVTDGECSDFGEAPEYPVLWILTQKKAGWKPNFGELACTINK